MRAPAAALVLLLCACSHAGSARERDLDRAKLALARELAARRAWPDVVAVVERIHASGARTPETLTLRGVAYREQRILGEAEADLRRAIELRDDHAPAHSALGVVLDLRGDAAGAERHHRRAVELAPQDALILNDWGFSLFLRGKTAEAVEVLRRAVDRAPLDPRLRNNLGFALGKSGDFTRAAEQFALGGTPAEAKNNLGFAYETAGNLAQAFESYLAAVRLDPALRRARANLDHVGRELNRAVPADVADDAQGRPQ